MENQINILTLYIATWQWFSLSLLAFFSALIILYSSILESNLMTIFLIIIALIFLSLALKRKIDLNKLIGVKNE